MIGDRRATIIGFAGALLVLAGLVWFVGPQEVIDGLSAADPPIVVLVVLTAVVWVSAWGMSLWTVLRALGAPISAITAVAVFSSAMFANNVTPFGQAGGEPVSALLISRASDSEYETGLAAIASVDTMHFGPSIGFTLIGLAYVVLDQAQLSRNIVVATGILGGLTVVLVVVGLLGWQYRYRLEEAVIRGVTPIVHAVRRVVPGLGELSSEAIRTRIEGFFHAIERVATDRRTIAMAIGFSGLGWLALSTALWLSLVAVGADVPFAPVLMVVPLGSIAGFTPLPGGSGAIEGAFVGLLVAGTGVSAGLATSAVMVHRAATYWLPTLIGGGVASAIGTSGK